MKYCFGRATDHACIDIRNKRITIEEGIQKVLEYDGKYPHYGVQSFVEYSGLSKKEIDDVIDSFTNQLLFKQADNGAFARDKDFNLIYVYSRF